MPYAIRDGERERKIEEVVPCPLVLTFGKKKKCVIAKFSYPVDFMIKFNISMFC
jgi:hypothetical protein